MSDRPDFDPADPTLPINRLAAAWPRLFHGAAPRWAGVAEGWFEIATDLCRQLDQLLSDEQAARFRVLDVKEKFGGLRFYCSIQQFPEGEGGDVDASESEDPDSAMPDPDASTRRRIGALIVEAENRAAVTCMKCGAPGTKDRSGGWILTLCPVHVAEQQLLRDRERTGGRHG